jgi:hypothetical protein
MTSALAVCLLLLGGLDWQAMNFRDQWPMAQATITDSIGYQQNSRPGLEDYPDTYAVYYRYTINEESYTGETRLKVFPMTRDEAAARYAPGQTLLVWYHPIWRSLSFASKMTPVYDIAILCVGGFLAVVSLTTLGKMFTYPPEPQSHHKHYS